jgi:pimeloyl-ACP methyl ester carboxylesterase
MSSWLHPYLSLRCAPIAVHWNFRFWRSELAPVIHQSPHLRPICSSHKSSASETVNSVRVQPVRFISGARDGVIRGATAEPLTASMGSVVTDLRGVVLIPEAGHWVQQDKPAETNAALLEFLKGLPSN